MILGIDTTKREKIFLRLFNKKKEECFEFKTDNQSDDILLAIEGILKINKISPQNLKGIIVDCGPGSFTGVRVGVVVANTLAWTLNLPVLGYKQKNYSFALAKILKNRQIKFFKPVIPYYQ